MFFTIFGPFIVALIWGITNPFIKEGSKPIASKHEDQHWLKRTITEIITLIMHPGYVIPFLCNIGGSVLYYFVLAHTDITYTAPVVNALTLVVSTVVSGMLGEPVVKGMLFGWFG